MSWWLVAIAIGAASPAAQTLGAFRWQLQPFCNAVTVTVTQQGGVYTIDGFDDQCGAPQRAPLVGIATPNPDGSIGFGLHLVTVPAGRGLDIAVRLNLATLSGPWTDSAGNSGTFAFNGPGGGSPRPAPTIPASMIAPGSIGATQINPAQVQARVSGTCTNGQAFRGVNTDGTVACTDIETAADDIANVVGLHSSLAIGTDGLPIIAHHDATAGALRVTHCGNSACTAQNLSTTVYDVANIVGRYASIGIGGDGLPVIAHQDATAQTVLVTHCGTVTCAAGNTTTIADYGYFSGLDPALLIGPNGFPLIAHQDTGANGLRITRCGNADCTVANSNTIDAPPGGAGGYPAITLGGDGLPIISHRTSGGYSALRVTHCGDATCTTGHVSTTVDAPPFRNVGAFTSIAIGGDGRPVVAHIDEGGEVRITHCGNAACTTGNASRVLVGPPDHEVLNYTAMIIAEGRPLVAFRDSTAGAVGVTHCGDVTCTAGNRTTGLDRIGNNVGLHLSMQIGRDGLPVISHHDLTAGSLRIVKCGTASCQ